MRSPYAVSIVINNYNYARFLRDAIDSALAQTYPGVEVVVVDDGSTDNSREIIASYSGQVIVIFKQNGGQASAFNAGFAASHGEIVIFLDADDMLLPQTAEKVAQAWQPDTVKVQYGLDAVDENSSLLGRLHMPCDLACCQTTTLLRRGLIINSPPTSGNAFARRALLKLLPMPEADWSIAADTYLYVLIPFLGEVSTLNEVLALYRLHSCNRWSARRLSLEGFKAQVLVGLRLQTKFRELAKHAGFCVPNDGLLLNLLHVEARILLLRLDRTASPFPGDRIWWLIIRGFMASKIDPWLSRRARLVYPLWLLAAGTVPRQLVLPLASVKQAWVTRRFKLRAKTSSRFPQKCQTG